MNYNSHQIILKITPALPKVEFEVAFKKSQIINSSVIQLREKLHDNLRLNWINQLFYWIRIWSCGRFRLFHMDWFPFLRLKKINDENPIFEINNILMTFWKEWIKNNKLQRITEECNVKTKWIWWRVFKRAIIIHKALKLQLFIFSEVSSLVRSCNM